MAEPASFQELEAAIGQVFNGETDDFFAIAQLLGLDPLTDLVGANLQGVNLSRASLSRADLQGVDLRGADLRGADLSGADLRRADLRRADLRGADLRRADLREANTDKADFNGANLRGTSLNEANLNRTKPSELNPSNDRNLFRVIFGGARLHSRELLRLYQSGIRDFRGKNLRGKSFKGQDLSGADFSHADIRGANFSGTKLTGTHFVRATAGLQRRWVAGLVVFAGLMAWISGLFSGLAGYLTGLAFSTESLSVVISGWVALAVLTVFFVITLRKGIRAGFGASAVTVGIGASLAVASGITSSGAVAITAAISIAAGVGVTGAIAGVVGISVAVAVALSVAGGVAFALTLILAIAGSIASSVAFAIAGPVAGPLSVVGSIPIVIVVSSVILSAYISWQAIVGNPKYTLIRSTATALAAVGGTSFQGADLTDANLSEACLNSTDLRAAILKRTSWHNTKQLDRVRAGNTYLKDAQICKLLQTRDGRGQIFDYQNLRGINLQGAQLADASFVAADLSEATLKNADLARAQLVQTQLDQTDLTGAYLTGACIEDWGLTGDTKLEGVRCEYVFMRWVRSRDSNGNPRRKPDNWEEVFADGDFAAFIKPIVDTLDLYHNHAVDPRAIAISFKQLVETNPDAELEIVAMEKREGDQLLLRAQTTETADPSELSRNYFETYNQVRALPDEEVRLLLAEKDDRIRSLETMVSTALKRPNFYAQSRGEVISDISGVSIGAGQNIGDISGVTGGDVGGVVNLGEIQGTVNNAINQLTDTIEADQTDLKTLLSQLQTAITEDSTLSNTEKATAFEKVQTLAQVGLILQEGKTKQLVRRAIGVLNGITSDLSQETSLMKARGEVLPELATLFQLDEPSARL